MLDPYLVFIGDGVDSIPDSSKILEEIRTEELLSLLQVVEWHNFPQDIVHLIHYPVLPASNPGGWNEEVD